MEQTFQKLLTKLRLYFEKEQSVAFAFIFGSTTAGTAGDDSDMDIAVYFYPTERILEVEGTNTYPAEGKIWGDIERITGRETDLIVLNRAAATVGAAVFYTGIPLCIHDEHLKWRYFLTVTDLAEEYRSFARDYIAIKARSGSLSEVDRDRLIRIIDFLETEMEDLSAFTEMDKKGYLKDSSIRRNVERWIENLVNASIDIAKILVSSQKQIIPQTYRETLLRLDTIPPFSSEEAQALAHNTKLRNILAHEYLEVKYPHIQKFVQTAGDTYKTLAQKTKVIVDK